MSTRSPTLSVCMITAYPPERVAAILEPLTGYVDEVVIAVDARVDEAAIPRYRAIADQVHRIEYVLVDRHLGWLHAQCRGDWILKLDGDEVPSSAFVRKLPELLATRQVMQYWVPNWWLYPDRTRVLDELPWSPDFNNRLVRNVGTLWFEGMEHSHAVPSFPSRYVEEPVYHLELLEEDETARRAKVVRYEVTRPHLVAHGGGRLNEAYYLPELRSELRTRKLAPEDQATLERVIHSPVTPPSPSRAQEPSSTRASQPSDVPVTPLAELDRYWVGRSFAPSTYAARLELFSPIERLVPERAGPVYVRVVNLGTDRFPGLPQHDPPIRLAYRWLRPDGTVYIADGVRTFLPCPLEPGEAAVVPVTVAAPAPGAYVLELDLVHEDVRWFDCALRVDVEVGDPLGLPAVGPRLTVTRRGRRQRLARRRIPRILHRLWLGAADMPEDLGAGWEGLRGAWEIRSWTDADLPSLGLEPARVESAMGGAAELSNLVRFEVLRRYGGVCADPGAQPRRPIDALLRGLSAFAVLERPGRVGTAVLGCVPDHPAFVRAAREAPRALRGADVDGSYFLSLILEQERNVTILDADSFQLPLGQR